MVEELVEEVEEEVEREKEEKEKKVTKVVEEESLSQTGGRAILASCPLPHTPKLVLSSVFLLSSESMRCHQRKVLSGKNFSSGVAVLQRGCRFFYCQLQLFFLSIPFDS